MQTLSIFCLGTSHEQDERWSIMRALYDLTDAVEITGDPLAPSASARRHGKVIFDGPTLFVSIDPSRPRAFDSSNRVLNANCDLAVAYVHSVRPERIALFGHSRGAVLSTMIAARLWARRRAAPHAYECDLFLVDLVTHTHALGGLPAILPAEARTVYPNVSSIVRVVMEDEYMPPPVFPLEDVRIDDGSEPNGTTVSDHVARASGRDIVFIRLPGGHGNATQVNPVAKRGEPLPEGTVAGRRSGELWPIGEVCLAHALDTLARGDTPVPLVAEAAGFRGDDRLLEAYSRIRLWNPRREDRQILLNDVDASRAGDLQKIGYQKGLRSMTGLNRYRVTGADHRFNALIVNEQHHDLIARLHGASLADAMRDAGTPGASRDLADHARSHLPEVEAALAALRRTHPNAFFTLVQGGFSIDGRRLFDHEALAT